MFFFSQYSDSTLNFTSTMGSKYKWNMFNELFFFLRASSHAFKTHSRMGAESQTNNNKKKTLENKCQGFSLQS